MEFVHLNDDQNATIAAVATPPGTGGVAIIRLSGKKAVTAADRIFSGPVTAYKSHTAHYGIVKTLEGERVDDVLLLVMDEGRSYTGETTVEIHCHGGSLITRRVLEAVLSTGVRAALPGEFTYRAFLNGRLDLAQAEAVQALIGAKSEGALAAAEQQLEGGLSDKVGAMQKELTRLAAIFEAWVDFPDEGLAFASEEEVVAQLETARREIARLIASYHQGKILHEGLSLCLVGAPNVGKSSLMNALLEKERAIVSPVAGTTRDLVEDHLRLGGLHFKIVDTAGMRTTTEQIEQEGIRRTHAAMKEADLTLMVLDASRPLHPEEEAWIAEAPPKRTVGVWNKIDLPEAAPLSLALPHTVALSAKERRGMEALKEAIDALLWEEGAPSKEEVVVTHVRHKEALEGAEKALQGVIEGLKGGVSPEFLTMDLRHALQQLGQIIGTNISEDVLSSIFSQFCIGK